ncbi:MAG: hypothetical protein LBF97_07075, partial [Elusimicrobiota bacterium]|nr:hypothetical protein [Elusimicrobiota bacterium]
ARLGEIVNSVNIRIVNEYPVKKNRFYFYADEIPTDLIFDTLNPGNENGGFMGIGKADGSLQIFKSDYAYEGIESLKIVCNNSVENFVFFQFGYDGTYASPIVETDLSYYNTLNFSIKSDIISAPAFYAIIVTNNPADTIKKKEFLTSEWQSISIPIDSNILTNFKQLSFKTEDFKSVDGIIYLDNIYFSRE